MRIPLHAVLFVALAACSSSSSGSSGASTPCNENPWECPSDQTCWPQSTTAFACLNAGPGKQGDACLDTVGSPTCGAGLFCLQSPGASMGTCVAYCSTTDPSHGCSGDVCTPVELSQTSGAAFSVCAPSQTPTPDAGSDTGSAAQPDAAPDAGPDAPAEASHD